MKVLLWHGYLLAGSGSNLFTANLARVWRLAGHDVLLLCQQRDAHNFEFVDEDGDFRPDNESYELLTTAVRPGVGRCRLLRPAIGQVLPVYVYDEYEGFVAKRFVDFSDEELERYVTSNVQALETALKEHEPEAIVTGHEVMGPFIALEACRQTSSAYLAKLHGSALEYAVKEQQRYRRYAQDGLCGAKVVTGGSQYMIREASSIVPGWEDRAVVVNPGCDVELFRPADRSMEAPPTVGYVGKLIVSKGVHHLLAALGLTSAAELRAVVVGYGGFARQLRALWAALQEGDVGKTRAIAERGDGRPLSALLGWLDSGGPDHSYSNRVSKIEVEWTGRLEHGDLSSVLPLFDVLVVPSVVPEAFGMVAAEAAACGVLPIVPAHSGIGEVGAAIEEGLGRPGLLTYDPATPIEGIASTIDRVLAFSIEERRDMGTAASSLARRLWSWERVAQQLLDLAGAS